MALATGSLQPARGESEMPKLFHDLGHILECPETGRSLHLQGGALAVAGTDDGVAVAEAADFHRDHSVGRGGIRRQPRAADAVEG